MPRWPPPSGCEALRPRAPQDGPLARSQRVSSRRLREASGWAPRMRAGTESLEPDRRMTAAERFAQARPRLLRLAYSELGDVGEAEDVVQEAWLRLERADAEAIENLDGWLTTVVARLALDRLRSARARRETYVGPWLPEPLVSDDPADRVTLDESVSYALLTVLEQLSPAERTAFVLHDVFDVPFGDVAEVVGRTPEAVRQLASRARRHVKRERPRFAASRDEHDRAVRAFAQAVAEGSLEGLVAVLDPDVVWTSDGGGRATAARRPLRGGARVARAWAALSRRSAHEPIEIELNGRLGLVLPSRDGHRAALSFVVSDGRITRIDAVRNPEKLRRLDAAPLGSPDPARPVARAAVSAQAGPERERRANASVARYGQRHGNVSLARMQPQRPATCDPVLRWLERWPHPEGYLRQRPPVLPHVRPTRSMDPGIRTIGPTHGDVPAPGAASEGASSDVVHRRARLARLALDDVGDRWPPRGPRGPRWRRRRRSRWPRGPSGPSRSSTTSSTVISCGGRPKE